MSTARSKDSQQLAVLEEVDAAWTFSQGAHTGVWGPSVQNRAPMGREGQQGASTGPLIPASQIVEVGLEVDQQVCPTPQSQASPQCTLVPDFYCNTGEQKLMSWEIKWIACKPINCQCKWKSTCEIQIKEVKGNLSHSGMWILSPLLGTDLG